MNRNPCPIICIQSSRDQWVLPAVFAPDGKPRNFLTVELLEAVRARRSEILVLAARRGVRNVRLFGSVVRGEATADSDVDFLVDLEPGRSLFDLGGLLGDLEALLGRNVDVVTAAGLRPRVRAGVLRDAAAL